MRVVVYWVDNFIGYKFVCDHGEMMLPTGHSRHHILSDGVNHFGAEPRNRFVTLPLNLGSSLTSQSNGDTLAA